MFKVIFPIIMTIAAIGLFVVFTNPAYKEISSLRTVQAAYDQALNNSQQLLKVRNDLMVKFNNLSLSDKDRLTKLMPDTVDNIRLIIDTQNIAIGHGMTLKDIKYDARAQSNATNTTTAPATPGQLAASQKDYGTFELEFSVTGTYQNFLAFITDIEQSLRLVDIESVTFQAPEAGSANMKYVIRIRTYWLKS
jgi:Tfp pilus assembly protein PilO